MAQRRILALRHGRKISCFLAYTERCNGCDADTSVPGTAKGVDLTRYRFARETDYSFSTVSMLSSSRYSMKSLKHL